MPEPDVDLSQQDELAGALAKTFIARRDVKAVQARSGAYTPDRSKWTMGDLRKHIRGEGSFGHYMLSSDNKAKLFAFDLDLREKIRLPDDPNNPSAEPSYRFPRWLRLDQEKGQVLADTAVNPRVTWNPTDPDAHESTGYFTACLRQVAHELALLTRKMLDIPVGIAYSGNKGLHVYGLTGEQDAADVHAAASLVLAAAELEPSKGKVFFKHIDPDFECIEVEMFPKQASLEGKDLGNLMRLPLGVNYKSGRRAFFINTDCPLGVIEPHANQLEAMTEGNFK